jgi:hypothetical protein
MGRLQHSNKKLERGIILSEDKAGASYLLSVNGRRFGNFRNLGPKGLWIERMALEWEFDIAGKKPSFLLQLQAQQQEGGENFRRENMFLAWLKSKNSKELMNIYRLMFEPHSFYTDSQQSRWQLVHRVWVYYLLIRSHHYKNKHLARALQAWCLALLQRGHISYEAQALQAIYKNPVAWNMQFIARMTPEERYAMLLANAQYMDRAKFMKRVPIQQCRLVADVLFHQHKLGVKTMMIRTLIREYPDMTYHEFLDKHGVFFTKKPTIQEFIAIRRDILGELDATQVYYWCDDICGHQREATMEVWSVDSREKYGLESWRLLVERVSRATRSGEEEYCGLRWLPRRTWDAKAKKSARQAYEDRLFASRDRRAYELSQLREIQEIWFHDVGSGDDCTADS